MKATSTSHLRETWEAAAPGWAKWEAPIAHGLEAPTDTLLDMAGVASGMRVLDLACGAGSQTLKAAERVGASGGVVAADISPTMLEHVRRRAAAAGLDNVETHESAAEELSVVDARFDAAISRLGLMLFAAPGEAVSAVRDVLKPGGRFAALVFTTPAANPFMAQPMAIALRHAGKKPPVPGQPGLFTLGAPDVLHRLLEDQGFTEVSSSVVRATLRLPDAGATLEMMQEAFGAYRAVLADLDAAHRARAWEEIHECLRGFETSDGLETELELLIGSGARPS
jgi:ubiquinone/menaquinone biosynthesis C-methylase UbiE